ncbi:MAG: cytidine deaminase [Candidatus Marinimicrobia bacterium]|nr:cytidine deaminase [Candidatus Neomarinimicrobiota bacterium]
MYQFNNLTPEKLIQHAIKAQERAVAPYSNYLVGAAILTASKTVILGCNVESKAYPTTLCAERVAIFSAISQGFTNFTALALITKDGASPCGSCRQIIHEYAADIPIYIANESGEYITRNISELLPFPFG